MMNDGVVEPFQQHHLLSMCAGVVREVLRHWITNRPRYHCYPESENQMELSKLKQASDVRKRKRNMLSSI